MNVWEALMENIAQTSEMVVAVGGFRAKRADVQSLERSAGFQFLHPSIVAASDRTWIVVLESALLNMISISTSRDDERPASAVSPLYADGVAVGLSGADLLAHQGRRCATKRELFGNLAAGTESVAGLMQKAVLLTSWL